MKKIKNILLVTFIFSILLTCNSVSASTQNPNITTKITYLDNGDYLETTIYENDAVLTRATSKKTGTKTTTYKSDGKALWYVSVTGTFTYTGTSSKCTAASVKAASYVDTWKISNKSSSYSSNTATGKATAKLYYGPLPVTTINESVILICNSKGDLS